MALMGLRCVLPAPTSGAMLYRELPRLKDEIKERVSTPVWGHTQLMPALFSCSPEPLSISVQCWGQCLQRYKTLVSRTQKG